MKPSKRLRRLGIITTVVGPTIEAAELRLNDRQTIRVTGRAALSELERVTAGLKRPIRRRAGGRR